MRYVKFFLISIIYFYSNVSIGIQLNLHPGDPMTGPAPTKIVWLDVYSDNGVVINGKLGVNWSIGPETAVSDVQIRMPTGNTAVTVNMCARGSGGGGVCTGYQASSMSCTTADGGNFETCISRYSGSSFYSEIEINGIQYGWRGVCLDIYLNADSAVTSQNGWGGHWTSASKRVCADGGPGLIPEPPSKASVCNLNSQNLNLSYSATSLNVDGLTQSANLNVICTAGDAQDYRLKLTGNNVTNGNLNFGNGVSAQVSLNGSQVQANGSGIQLNRLTSQTIPVSATLTGNASISGVSKATGILVLEAL